MHTYDRGELDWTRGKLQRDSLRVTLSETCKYTSEAGFAFRHGPGKHEQDVQANGGYNEYRTHTTEQRYCMNMNNYNIIIFSYNYMNLSRVSKHGFTQDQEPIK